jgi:hypothetical protein
VTQETGDDRIRAIPHRGHEKAPVRDLAGAQRGLTESCEMNRTKHVPPVGNDTIRYGRRAQTFAPVPEWVIVAGLTPQALSLYTVLLAHVNRAREDGVVWPGMQVLAELLGYNRRQSVARYLDELEALGAIEVIREVPCANGWRNEYVVHEVAPDGYACPRSLGEFYAARREAKKGMCAVAHHPSDAAAHQGSFAAAHTNQKNSTRRREPDEENASSEDAPAGAHEQARGRANESSKRIHIDRPVAADEKQLTQKLVAASTAAMKKAGQPLGSRGRADIGAWVKDNVATLPVDELAAALERGLTSGLAGDTDYAWLFQDLPKTPARPNTLEGLDELHDDYDGVPGSAAIDNLAAQGYHVQAIENIVLNTVEVMA